VKEIGGKHYGGPFGKKISWLFFFPKGSTEWTQCVSMGPPAARELCPISKTISTKLSVFSVVSSDPERREGERVVKSSAPALWNPACGGFAPVIDVSKRRVNNGH
jgi:hypothetical protein